MLSVFIICSRLTLNKRRFTTLYTVLISIWWRYFTAFFGIIYPGKKTSKTDSQSSCGPGIKDNRYLFWNKSIHDGARKGNYKANVKKDIVNLAISIIYLVCIGFEKRGELVFFLSAHSIPFSIYYFPFYSENPILIFSEL